MSLPLVYACRSDVQLPAVSRYDEPGYCASRAPTAAWYWAGSVTEARKTTKLPSQAGWEIGTASPRSPVVPSVGVPPVVVPSVVVPSVVVPSVLPSVAPPGSGGGTTVPSGLVVPESVPESVPVDVPPSAVLSDPAPEPSEGEEPAFSVPAAVGSTPLRHSTIATATSRIA